MSAKAMRGITSIRGGQVFDGKGFAPLSVGVDTKGQTFSWVRPAAEDGGASPEDGDEALDATGCYVIPGLVDVHFHGCMGSDLCDATPEALHVMAAHEASRGVTSICPASMTFPTQTLLDTFSNAAAFTPAAGEARLVGINMEGPYISPDKVGAQNPAYVRGASIEEFALLQRAAGGLIRLVDVAPEEAGALEFIREASPRVRVSVAHTCADYDCAREAFECGARHVTHLFNAMPGLHHRKPGPIAAAAERDDVTAELICDGVHVHPAMARLAFSLFGADRVVMISDSMRACGLADGTYDLGGQDVHVQGPRATLADGTLAGSVSDLMTCLRVAVTQMGIPLVDAVRATTANPARAIGVYDTCGSIEAGKLADAVVLDAGDLSVRHVVMRGRLLR